MVPGLRLLGGIAERRKEKLMRVYGAVAAILGYLIMGVSAVAADNDKTYMVRAVYLYHECHVQPEDGEDIGLVDVAGPFSSQAEACNAAANLCNSAGEDQTKCWRHGTFTPRNCEAVGVTLPGEK
jgi:hypothetical protein